MVLGPDPEEHIGPVKKGPLLPGAGRGQDQELLLQVGEEDLLAVVASVDAAVEVELPLPEVQQQSLARPPIHASLQTHSSAGDERDEDLGRIGLAQEDIGALAEELVLGVALVVAREHDHEHLVPPLAPDSSQGVPGIPVLQVEIEHQPQGARFGEHRHDLSAPPRDPHLIAAQPFQNRAQVTRHLGVVFSQHDAIDVPQMVHGSPSPLPPPAPQPREA